MEFHPLTTLSVRVQDLLPRQGTGGLKRRPGRETPQILKRLGEHEF